MGTENASPNTIVGNATMSGATTRIVLPGANPSDATHPLPPGTDVTLD